MGPYTVTAISFVALVVWVIVLGSQWGLLRRDEPLPNPVREATVVALLSALVGGTIASLGFAEALDGNISAIFGGAWRGAVLACGVYALVAVAKLRRRGR